jgi:N-acetylneuraminic acid mutarotase
VGDFERFDLRERRYSALPPLPEALNHVGLGAYRGDVYLVGGAGNRLAPFYATRSMWRYRPTDRRWQEVAPMPTRRAALGVAVVGDRLFAIGGAQGTDDRTANEAYDFRTGRWSSRRPMPTARDHLGVAAMNGLVYAAGGRTVKGGNRRELERYDPTRDRWQRLAPLPAGVSGVQLVPVHGRLILAGGEDNKRRWVTGAVHAYDPVANSWRRLPSLRTPVHGYAASAAGDRLYVFGGSDCSGFRATGGTQSVAPGLRARR